MSLATSPASLSIRSNRSYALGATGGVPPYTWAMMTNVSGGSVTSSGVYTAGSTYGSDVLIVTDSTTPTPMTATVSANVNTVLQIVGDIIATGLGLGPDQYWLWDQKIDIPTDQRPYLILSVVNEKAYGQSNTPCGGDSDDDPLTSMQSVNIQARVGLDFLSRGPAARDMKDMILLALNSNYSESQQELNSIYIGRGTASFVNLSQVDGAAIPYRFHLEVNVMYAISQTTVVPYYDELSTPAVTTEP